MVKEKIDEKKKGKNNEKFTVRGGGEGEERVIRVGMKADTERKRKCSCWSRKWKRRERKKQENMNNQRK